ncbi:fructosamine kinase [Salinicoccus sediminis]|uniref:Fructosamine kinase n=1 Tax=Salinicoccus sediminis TaxID=1432562 RepID=A0A0M2SK77_9STAP|nr:fructosamine kinase family protein [Salinicoccus sediminis]KKK32980.1 fructosamine kinase [Salinicoccus sediminis]
MNQEWIEKLPVDGIRDIIPVPGGDVNDAYRVETDDDPEFLLVQPGRSEAFYAAEIAGLEAFEEAGITAPRVLGSGEFDDGAWLLLTYLEEGSGSQKDLGQMVAKMHLTYQNDGMFGFGQRHEGGDISFDNGWTDSWSELFIARRMDVLKERIVDKGLWTIKDSETYMEVRNVMTAALEEHSSEPSLLHGDLWAGNYMFLSDGRPALFDPSPLYGDREFDLGATTVFGGFSGDFYDAYEAEYPLGEGAWERIRFYRLYLLMVHLAKFGGIYKTSVHGVMQDILNG